MEYIYTNLPQYVKTNSRTEFSSSVVSSGAVLLFSENGSSLTAKLPDGSFITIGGSGGATDFYKCASIDTVNHTWTGYKAIFDSVSGTYSFAATVTSGLTYGSGFTPMVGGVYTDGALVKADLYTGFPVAGLDFYAAFSQNMNDTVHALTGTTEYSEYFYIDTDATGGFLRCNKPGGGWGDVHYDNSGSLFAYGTGDFTISFWLRAPDWDTLENVVLLAKKENDGDNGFAIFDYSSRDKMDFRCGLENNFDTTAGVSSATWVNWCIVRRGGTGYWYRNGIENASGAMASNVTSSQILRIGYHGQPGWASCAVYDLKAVRIYNRGLSAGEVAALAAEFTSAS